MSAQPEKSAKVEPAAPKAAETSAPTTKQKKPERATVKKAPAPTAKKDGAQGKSDKPAVKGPTAKAKPDKQGPGGQVRALPQFPHSSPYGRKPLSDTLRQRRAAKRRRRMLSLGLTVGLPTLLAVFYYGFVASDRYESVSTFTVHSADGRAVSGITQLLGSISGGSASRDVLVVRDYILSRDMLAYLIEEHRWREHFTQPEADLVMRLPADADSEATFEDYLDRVQVTHDTDSDALTMRIQAFSADAAERFARAILERSERAVNRLSEKAREDAISFAKREVESARSHVESARSKLLDLQGEDAEFNPMQSAAAVQQIRASLETELATKRAELNALSGVMRPTAPKVIELRQQVRSLSREVDRQRRRLVNPDDRGSVNESIAKYEPTLFEKEFAERALQSALTSLEMARVDASMQHRYLVTISQPSHPDASTHPERALGVLTVFLLSLVAASIGALVLATVREHSRT